MSARDDYPDLSTATDRDAALDEIDMLRESCEGWVTIYEHETSRSARLATAVRAVLTEWDAVEIDADCVVIDEMRRLFDEYEVTP